MLTSTLLAIKLEQDRQLEKFGYQSHHSLYWLAILAEEVGELGKAILERKPDEIRAELIQCAAVCCTWLDYLTRQVRS